MKALRNDQTSSKPAASEPLMAMASMSSKRAIKVVAKDGCSKDKSAANPESTSKKRGGASRPNSFDFVGIAG